MGLRKTFFGVTALEHCSAGYRDRDCRSDNRTLRRVQEEKTASALKWSRTWSGMHRSVDRAVSARRNGPARWHDLEGKKG